jgi:hypothetical protein
MISILESWTIRTVTEDAPFEPGTEVTFREDEDGNVIVAVNGDEYAGRYDASKTKVIVNPPKEQQHWEFVVTETLGDPPSHRMYGFSWAGTRAQPDPMGSWAADPQGR